MERTAPPPTCSRWVSTQMSHIPRYAYLLFDKECKGVISREEVTVVVAENGQKDAGSMNILSQVLYLYYVDRGYCCRYYYCSTNDGDPIQIGDTFMPKMMIMVILLQCVQWCVRTPSSLVNQARSGTSGERCSSIKARSALGGEGENGCWLTVEK